MYAVMTKSGIEFKGTYEECKSFAMKCNQNWCMKEYAGYYGWVLVEDTETLESWKNARVQRMITSNSFKGVSSE